MEAFIAAYDPTTPDLGCLSALLGGKNKNRRTCGVLRQLLQFPRGMVICSVNHGGSCFEWWDIILDITNKRTIVGIEWNRFLPVRRELSEMLLNYLQLIQFLQPAHQVPGFQGSILVFQGWQKRARKKPTVAVAADGILELQILENPLGLSKYRQINWILSITYLKNNPLGVYTIFRRTHFEHLKIRPVAQHSASPGRRAHRQNRRTPHGIPRPHLPLHL